MSEVKVSIVIATYNMGHLIKDTIKSCLEQDYDNIEIIVYDDCSTDNTQEILDDSAGIIYHRAKENAGVGAAFNAGMKLITGKYFVLMCADDLFTDKRYISDVVREFERDEEIVHVTRYYYQFIDGDQRPVRAWRDQNPVILANQPSGLAFRASALNGHVCSNKMFIETSYLASNVMKEGSAKILPYDAIAARVHASTSTRPGYWLERRVSSPVMDWHEIGGAEIAKDYVSFVQIRNGFKLSAVFEEIGNFIKLRPINLLIPTFWFWSAVAVLTPRKLLLILPGFYRKHIGIRITKEIKRDEQTNT